MKAARARSAAFAWNAGRQVPVLRPAFAGARGSAPSGGNREALSTVTAPAGGPARSSAETPVMGAERRGRLSGFVRMGNRAVWPGRRRVSRSESQDKPFVIPKQLVWEAWKRVRANKGAPGVDMQSLAEFESDLGNNLYKMWNRMLSGTYFPPPVRAVEIPKPHGGGVRILGVPTVADRVAQTVAAMALEARTESICHDDSYGYRPRRGALDALAKCRLRCQKKNWVLDLDVQKFFDSVDHQLMVKAVEANTTHEQRWVVLYVKRWLKAPLHCPTAPFRRGTAEPRGVCGITRAREPVHALRVRHLAGTGVPDGGIRALCGRRGGALRD